MGSRAKSGKGKGASAERLALVMWSLLTQENSGAFRSELKPKLEKAEFDALITRGLVRAQKRRNDKTGGRGDFLEVTDQGWEWAGKNLAAPLPKNSNAGTVVLSNVLMRLQRYLEASNVALVDILDPRPAKSLAEADAARTGVSAIRQRIRNAYLDITNGRLNTRAMLKDVRARLADVDRETLDQALKQMQQDEAAILYQLDNRVELTDADRNAAIYFAGEPRHILWIER